MTVQKYTMKVGIEHTRKRTHTKFKTRVPTKHLAIKFDQRETNLTQVKQNMLKRTR